jgi:hypothetical protein
MGDGWAIRVGWRLLPVALAVLFAGVLALPVKRSAHEDVVRVASVGTPSAPAGPSPALAAARGRAGAAPVPSSPSSTSDERLIQPPTGAVVPVAGDAAADTTSTAASNADPLAGAPVLASAGGPATGKVWAVVIGINDYPDDSNDLSSAVADADDMVAALHRFGVDGDHLLLAEDGDATGRGILETLDWLNVQAAPEDTAVFFYAGHARKLDQTTEAVVGADGRVVPDWLMAQHLAGLRAHDAWIVMASCYGGGFTELLQPGRVLTAAAGADDLAYESQTFGRSYLGEYLVRRGLLLGGAAEPTAQQAFDYAQAALQQEHPDRVLTEVDESTAPVSLDGQHRDHVPPPPQAPPPPDAPTTTAPPPPKSCSLLVLCSG